MLGHDWRSERNWDRTFSRQPSAPPWRGAPHPFSAIDFTAENAADGPAPVPASKLTGFLNRLSCGFPRVVGAYRVPIMAAPDDLTLFSRS
jgi:hypothetical protein